MTEERSFWEKSEQHETAERAARQTFSSSFETTRSRSNGTADSGVRGAGSEARTEAIRRAPVVSGAYVTVNTRPDLDCEADDCESKEADSMPGCLMR